MKRIFTAMTALALVAISGAVAVAVLPAAQAARPAANGVVAERTVTFAIENMSCAACPITVRKAMEKVAGVKSVTVDFAAKTATVVFDPALATTEQIGAASTNAGYPATPTS